MHGGARGCLMPGAGSTVADRAVPRAPEADCGQSCRAPQRPLGCRELLHAECGPHGAGRAVPRAPEGALPPPTAGSRAARGGTGGRRRHPPAGLRHTPYGHPGAGAVARRVRAVQGRAVPRAPEADCGQPCRAPQRPLGRRELLHAGCRPHRAGRAVPRAPEGALPPPTAGSRAARAARVGAGGTPQRARASPPYGHRDAGNCCTPGAGTPWLGAQFPAPLRGRSAHQ